MFQLTLQRVADDNMFNPPIIVGSENHKTLISEQLAEIGITPAAIIYEPCARNTAPAIALAALAAENPQDLLLIMPSDHVIKNQIAFLRSVEESVSIGQSRWLVTFGITPTEPATGYGYIQQGREIIGTSSSFQAQRFVEKPNEERAKDMLDEGGFYWNAGIFLFRADAYLAEMEKFVPDMLATCQESIDQSLAEKNAIFPNKLAFEQAPSDSIDYAIMERASQVAVTPTNPGWSDVGSWDSLYEITAKEENRNAVTGSVTALESSGNLIHSNELEISTYGVEDLIIVGDKNRVMILPRGQSQHVKEIVKEQSKER